MKVTEYRRIVDALARFASSRPKAVGPESRIGVQVSKDGLKFISGGDTAGLIYTVSPDDWEGEKTDDKYGFTVDARPLLESGKVLPTKDTVRIVVTRKTLSIIASGGGRLELKAVGKIGESGFPKKPKDPKAVASVYAEQWGQLARIITDIADRIERPTLHYIPNEGTNISIVSPGMRAKYANVRLPSEGEEFSVVTELPFWDALRVMDRNGALSFGPHGVLAKSENIECFSTLVLSDKEFFWPVLAYDGGSVSFTMERNALITAIRSQAPNDEHNRVTFDVSEGRLLVTAFGNEDGLTIPVRTKGEGFRSLNAGYLRTLLSSMTDTKEVTLTWGNPAPAIRIEAKEYAGWTLLMAPVALR